MTPLLYNVACSERVVVLSAFERGKMITNVTHTTKQ